jgi:hypothetical protein
MARITNTSSNPLSLPGGELLQPKQSLEVKDWDKVKEHGIVKAWLESGQIKEGAGDVSSATATEEEVDDEDEVEDEDDTEDEDDEEEKA